MGLVIASGLAISTLFTLFVVPAVYLVVGPSKIISAAHDENRRPNPVQTYGFGCS